LLVIDVSRKTIGLIFKKSKMGPVDFSETSIANNYSALRNITEEQKSQTVPKA
jgi:hypothetical protein